MPGTQLRQLVEPFPKAMVRAPAPGKFGNYVPHNDYVQRALSIIGAHDFALNDLIRGYAAEIISKDRDGKVKNTWPERFDAVVGVTATLVVMIDGVHHEVTEVGTEDNPAMHHDAINAKNALSDAYKRCWMRLGLGLHLWCDSYWLDKQLDKDTADTDG